MRSGMIALLIWIAMGLAGTFLLDILFDHSFLVSAVVGFGFSLIVAGPGLVKKRQE